MLRYNFAYDQIDHFVTIFCNFSIFKVIEKEAGDNQEHINFTLEAMTSHLSKGEA